MTNIRAIAVIPARGGSKGLPRKNILPLAGKPMLSWTIKAAKETSFVERIVVTSDDDEVLEVASNLEVECVLRPKELATDNALSAPVLSHVLDVLPNLEEINYVAFLQPTSPLRNSYHLKQAFKLIKRNGASSLISVVKPEKSPLKSFVINREGFLRGAVNCDYPFYSRQSLPESFYANGAIYIVEKEFFITNKKFLSDKCIPFMMDAESSLDIDCQNDLEVAAKLLDKKT